MGIKAYGAFNVAAMEVKNLAEQSNVAAKEIEELIVAILNALKNLMSTMNIGNEGIHNGENVIREGEGSFRNIQTNIMNVSNNVTKLSESIGGTIFTMSEALNNTY